jgi:hypothetical protein
MEPYTLRLVSRGKGYKEAMLPHLPKLWLWAPLTVELTLAADDDTAAVIQSITEVSLSIHTLDDNRIPVDDPMLIYKTSTVITNADKTKGPHATIALTQGDIMNITEPGDYWIAMHVTSGGQRFIRAGGYITLVDDGFPVAPGDPTGQGSPYITQGIADGLYLKLDQTPLQTNIGTYASEIKTALGAASLTGGAAFTGTVTVNGSTAATTPLANGIPGQIALYGKLDSGVFGTLAKGTPVYISGATGNNKTLSPADAADEPTSSKTIGLLLQSLVANGFGYVVTEGDLENISFAAGTYAGTLIEGAQAWLNLGGGIYFGTPPSSINHLVFLGVVTRVQGSTSGTYNMYVKVQNGYELNELHDVTITSPATGQVLAYNGSGLWVNRAIAASDLGSDATNTKYLRGDMTWQTVTSGGGATNLDGLSDVTITETLANKNVLRYDSSATKWKNSSLGDLADQSASSVTITGGTISSVSATGLASLTTNATGLLSDAGAFGLIGNQVATNPASISVGPPSGTGAYVGGYNNGGGTIYFGQNARWDGSTWTRVMTGTGKTQSVFWIQGGAYYWSNRTETTGTIAPAGVISRPWNTTADKMILSAAGDLSVAGVVTASYVGAIWKPATTVYELGIASSGLIKTETPDSTGLTTEYTLSWPDDITANTSRVIATRTWAGNASNINTGTLGTAYGGTGLNISGGGVGQSLRVASGGTTYEWYTPGTGSGSVTGPTTSSINNIAVFGDMLGDSLLDSGVSITSGELTATTLNASNIYATTKTGVTYNDGTIVHTGGITLNSTTHYPSLHHSQGTNTAALVWPSELAVTSGGASEEIATKTYSSNPANLASAVPTNKGGTGLSTIGSSLQVLRVKSDSSGLEYATLSAGGVTGTGAVANAVLRASGTTGDALKNSDIIIDDATTSTQANVTIVNNHTGQTNSAFVITPKGTGAFIVGKKPDGTAAGGNSRGANAIDIQTLRTAATEVASGSQSIAIGSSLAVSGGQSVVIGTSSSATGPQAIAIGQYCSGGGQGSCAIGYNASSTATVSFATGWRSVASHYGSQAHASGYFAAQGDAQRVVILLRCKTTTNTAVEMATDGVSARFFIASGRIFSGLLNIHGIKSDGTASAHYIRQVSVKNVGGTTSLVQSVAVGTDVVNGTSISITADNTADILSIQVTGVASETWRWVANFTGVDTVYGT